MGAAICASTAEADRSADSGGVDAKAARAERDRLRHAARRRSVKLMKAAAASNTEGVLALLAEGADANAQDERGWTPLMHAVARGGIDCVRLLAPISDMNAKDRGFEGGKTPLMMAVERPVQFVEALLPRSNPNATERLGRNALMVAIAECASEAVEALAPHTDPLARDNGGRTALLFAASSAWLTPAAVRSLLSVCDPRETTLGGRCALEIALESGNTVAADLIAIDPRTTPADRAAAVARAEKTGKGLPLARELAIAETEALALLDVANGAERAARCADRRDSEPVGSAAAECEAPATLALARQRGMRL